MKEHALSYIFQNKTTVHRNSSPTEQSIVKNLNRVICKNKLLRLIDTRVNDWIRLTQALKKEPKKLKLHLSKL